MMNKVQLEEQAGVAPLATEHGTIDGYRVVYEQGPRNWSAYSPDVPGCIATGRDRGHVEHMLREAIAFHLEDSPAHQSDDDLNGTSTCVST